MLQKSENMFDLKWNNFAAHLTELSTSFLQDTSLLDLSIQCGTEVVKAHKLVLSACSPWFREVISNMQASTSPLVVLWETNMEDMKSILSFMYNGEVQVQHDSLLSFLKLAGYLQVKGLTQGIGKNEGSNKVIEEEGSVTMVAEEEKLIKNPLRDELRSSRPSSRVFDKSTSRNETSETRLTREDFDLSEKKPPREIAGERPHTVGQESAVKKSDFEIKSDYERAKVKEIRLKEIMKNSGKDRSFEKPEKKKLNVKKESLREHLKSFQSSRKTVPEKPTDNEESLLEAMLERRSMLEKINNAPLSRFESKNDESSEYSPDFDPSLLVKTEIDETVEEEVLNTAGPSLPFSHTPAEPFKPTSISGLMCTQCGKGPYAKGKLSTHMKNVHSGMEYECTTCVKTFKCERYLLNHKRQYCPDRFKQ